jgi:hypothetical protein
LFPAVTRRFNADTTDAERVDAERVDEHDACATPDAASSDDLAASAC